MMAPALNNLLNYFTRAVVSPNSLRVFVFLVYAWLLGNALSLWEYGDLLWSKSKIFYRHGIPGNLIENFFYQLVWHPTRFKWIFSIHLVGSLLGMLDKRWSLIPRLAAWATGLIIFYSAVEVFNSGMLLMILMSFFASVVYIKARTPYGIALTNAARIACIAQLVLVYLTAGVYKLSGTQWLDGSALYYTAHIDHFSSPWLKEFLTNHYFISKILTWIGLGYQLLFPLVLVVKKGRWLFLCVGIAFHLFIGMFMHLWDFALAMMICYVVLIPESFWQKAFFQHILIRGKKWKKRKGDLKPDK